VIHLLEEPMASEPSDTVLGSSLALSSSVDDPACPAPASLSSPLAASDSSVDYLPARLSATPGASGSASGTVATSRAGLADGRPVGTYQQSGLRTLNRAVQTV
jgi:hypothetical protein